MVVARLLPGGRLDPGFGNGGVVFPAVASNSDVRALALEHGEILVAGTERSGRQTTAVILRYRSNGRLDRSFGTAGEVREADRGKPLTDSEAGLSLLLTPRRLIVVRAGVHDPVSAYRRDGTPIPSYGRAKGVVPNHPRKGHPRYGPVGALQGNRPILAWTAVVRHGHQEPGSTGWVQRLTGR